DCRSSGRLLTLRWYVTSSAGLEAKTSTDELIRWPGAVEDPGCQMRVKNSTVAAFPSTSSIRPQPAKLQCAQSVRTGAGIPHTAAERAGLATRAARSLCSPVMHSTSVFFVSDAHLGVETAEREGA